jgi:hypothetical protein
MSPDGGQTHRRTGLSLAPFDGPSAEVDLLPRQAQHLTVAPARDEEKPDRGDAGGAGQRPATPPQTGIQDCMTNSA